MPEFWQTKQEWKSGLHYINMYSWGFMRKYHWFGTSQFIKTFTLEVKYNYLWWALQYYKEKVKQTDSMTEGICKFIPWVAYVYYYILLLYILVEIKSRYEKERVTYYQAGRSYISWNIVVFRILRSDWPRVLLPPPNYKFSNLSIPDLNLYQHAKHHTDWRNCSWVVADSWLAESIFTNAKLNIHKPSFRFLESISVCQKASWFIKYYLKYSWLKNSAT